MHGDISAGNVRIYDPNPKPTTASVAGDRRVHQNSAPERRRRGILIDMDNAMEFDEDWNLTSRPLNYMGQVSLYSERASL